MSRIGKIGTSDDKASDLPQDSRCRERSSRNKGSMLHPKLVAAVIFLAALLIGYFLIDHLGYMDLLTSEQRLRNMVANLGAWGILVLIASIALAIVMSPVPSGPIAMVAGAVYGPVWGGVYTVLGSVLGAAVAFTLAHWLGYDFVCRWLSRKRLDYLTQKRSQNRLMGIVFLTRLVPFISFDAVSYASGLTPLSFWRFIIASFAGVMPISFLLTFFGGQLTTLDSRWTLITTILVGGITLLPLLFKWIKDRKHA